MNQNIRFCKIVAAIVIIFLVSLQSWVLGQSAVELSKVILPSPNAASLGNFGNNSKGTYNGVPEISISLLQNIFPNQAGNVTLSYDASGTRCAQEATWVGLGWSLAYGGGVITRTVRGTDDFYHQGYHSIDTLPSQTTLNNLYATEGASDTEGYLKEYLRLVRNGYYDTEPDIFNFSVGKLNGKFVFDKISRGASIVQLEGTNIKISYLNPGWKLTDGDGNQYYFNNHEFAQNWSKTEGYEINYKPSYNEFFDNSSINHNVITAWYLDSIITAKAETLRFSYSTEESLSLMNKSEQKFELLQIAAGCGDNVPHDYYTASQQIQYNKLPYKITFPNGSLEFLTAARSDIKDIFGRNTSRLDCIVEKDKKGGILRKYKFYYSYFNQNHPDSLNRRLKLDSIQEISDPQHPLPPYRMAYFNPNSLPPKITKAIDHWGYYNRQTVNETLTPATTVAQPYYRSFPGANRTPDTLLSSVQNGVLSSLVYPTGGRTVFSYELNEYSNLVGSDKWNIKDTTYNLGWAFPSTAQRTATFTLSETTEVKFYFDYHDPANFGYRDEFINDYAFLDLNSQPYETFRNAQFGAGGTTYITERTLLLNPGTYTIRMEPLLNTYQTILTASFSSKLPVSHRKGGGLRIKRIENYDNVGGKSVKRFLYNNGSLTSGTIIAPVSYDFTPLVEGTQNCTGGISNVSAIYIARYSSTIGIEGFTRGGLIGYSKVIELQGESGEFGKMEYTFYNNPLFYAQTPSVPYVNDAMNGKLLVVKYYDNTNTLKQMVRNSYSYQSSTGAINVPGLKLLSFPWTTSAFYTTLYSNLSTWCEQTKEEKISFFGLDSVKTVKDFYFGNPVHKQMTKMELHSSNTGVSTSVFKYAEDYKGLEVPNIYNTLSERNYHNAIVEELAYKNGQFLNSKKVNYDFWKNGSWGNSAATLILPKSVETKYRDNPVEQRISYKAYDENGNLLTQSQTGGTDIAYIWGYEGQYPVAEVKNARRNNVFLQNFEEGAGNTSFNDAKTGYYSYNGNYLHTLSGLDDGQYVLRYWQKNGTWSLKVSTVNVAGGSYDINLSGQLDDVCFYPTGAQMTTFTFDPLVGVTSSSDARAQTTNYEYDVFKRLKGVKDAQGNVLKSYDYHYKP